MRTLQTTSLALLLGMAGATQGADLMEIFRMAQSADAQYAAARATWSAGQEKLPQGLAGLLPSATVSASTQYNDREIRTRDPAVPTTTSQFNSNAASVSVTQPLYRPQNYTAYDQAKSQVVQSDAIFAQAAQDLILRVAQAYFDVLLAQDTIVFAQAQLVAIGR
ncbi:MAG: TolC family protein, partial [Burkholderiales bacterium]